MEVDQRLENRIKACTNCPALVAERTHVVPAEVGSNYQYGGLAILAEAPGRDEDRSGRPLVGRAGKLMDSVLEAAGVDRSQLLLMNTVRCRPPSNRLDRHPEALLACNDWTIAELNAYQPRVVLLTGNTPMRRVYGQQSKITAVRGKPRSTSEEFEYGERVWVPTWHPAYCLRNPASMGELLDDLKLALELL